MAHPFEVCMKKSCSESLNEVSEQTLLSQTNSLTLTHTRAMNHPLPIISLPLNGNHFPFIKIKMVFCARTNCKDISLTA